VLSELDLELGELALGERSLLAHHLELALRERDLALLRLRPSEELARARERAPRLVAPRARLVEPLHRRHALLLELALAHEVALREIRLGLGTRDLGAVRRDVVRPGALGERHLLLLAAQLRVGDGELLALRRHLRRDVRRVEPRDDGVRGHRVALAVGDLEDAARDLAPQHALLALDEAGVERLAPRAPQPPGARGQEREHRGDDHDPAAHAPSPSDAPPRARRPIPPSENERMCPAIAFAKSRG
jgi:hypothetical protein